MRIASTRQEIITSLAALLIALIFCPAIQGQSNRGTITGIVVDAHGGVIPNAGVSVVNVSTQGERLTTTNAEGSYTVPSLEPGPYKVTVTASGFQTVVREQITLQTNDRVAVDVTLPVGDVGTQTMTITSEVPLVNSESSVRGDVITGRQVTDLPIPQRNFTILATLVPGVTRPAVGTLGGGGNFV
jgi:Carboxypeptidase regulatory-like domain